MVLLSGVAWLSFFSTVQRARSISARSIQGVSAEDD
jgi:hypothetical protein